MDLFWGDKLYMENKQNIDEKELKIIFDKKNENCVNIDNNINDTKGFFYDSYCKARECIYDIIKNSDSYEFGLSKSNSNEYISKLAFYPNNIIAFLAGRGQGKSSAMFSFSYALKKYFKNNDTEKDIFWENNLLKNRKIEFIFIDAIDPTLMESTDSILHIILSRLFKKFRNHCEDKNNKHGYSEEIRDSFNYENIKHKLLENFRECYKALDLLKENKTDDYYDDLSYLSDLGDSSCLKEKLFDLVKNFCSFINLSSSFSSNFLVLKIDDADLNTKCAFSILEDIRKYLTIPRVIILMASDFKQLNLLVEQHFIFEFKELIKHDNILNKSYRANCHDAAKAYINKLIPLQNQIHLPSVDEMIQSQNSSIYLKYIGGNSDFNSEFQLHFIKKIYNKTGIILVKPKFHMHPLIPNNMRMATNFLSLLDTMEDVRSGNSNENLDISLIYKSDISELKRKKINVDKIIKNLECLEQYFYYQWCDHNLSVSEKVYIDNLHNTQLFQMNKCVIQLLAELYREDGYKPLDLLVNNNDISLAHIMEEIRSIRNDKNKKSHEKLLYAIEFYYTIRLHHFMLIYKNKTMGQSDDFEKYIVHLPVKLLDHEEMKFFEFKLRNDISEESKMLKYIKKMVERYSMSDDELEYNIQYFLQSQIELETQLNGCNPESVNKFEILPYIFYQINIDLQNLLYNSFKRAYKMCINREKKEEGKNITSILDPQDKKTDFSEEKKEENKRVKKYNNQIFGRITHDTISFFYGELSNSGFIFNGELVIEGDENEIIDALNTIYYSERDHNIGKDDDDTSSNTNE